MVRLLLITDDVTMSCLNDLVLIARSFLLETVSIVYILSVSEGYFYTRLFRGPCAVVVPCGGGKTSPLTSI